MMLRVLQLTSIPLCLLVSAVSAAGTDSLVETPDDAGTICIRDWVKPAVPCDPAFRDVAVGLNRTPIKCVVTVAPGGSYVVALGFCEGCWDKPGQRIVDVSIDGKHRAAIDTIADTGGHGTPFVLRLPATDDDRDGQITVEVRAAEASPDVNSILNVMWVFDASTTPSIDTGALTRGELNAGAYVYYPAGKQAIDGRDAHFQVMGRRCVAHLNTANDSAGAVAFAMTEGLSSLRIRLDGSTIETTTIRDNWLERQYQLVSGAQARSYWFSSVDKPAFLVLVELNNPTKREVRTRLSARARPNPGYFSKFAVRTDDTARCKDGIVTATDSKYPQVRVCAGIFPSPRLSTVRCGETDSPGAVTASMEREVVLPPGESATYCLAVVGGDGTDPGFTDLESVLHSVGSSARAEFDKLRKTVGQWEQDRLVVDTPDDRLDRYFGKAKQWAFKDTRVLPFGEPFSLTDATKNKRIPVLTASPVYHGVFANDNIQSIWEWGALGSSIYPVLENSLDAMSGFGTPESVEWFLGDGSIFLAALRIGQHAEWVTGACSLMLWSGERKYQDKYWPKVRELLGRFRTEFDKDHDYLDDYSCSPFPEHPNPGTYNHEMLYASAFWYKAFDTASVAAEMIGDTSGADEYSRTAMAIRRAINSRFRAPWGYAGWLNSSHEQHKHVNHNSVLPVEYGIATDQDAERVFESLFSPESMTEWGPLHMDSKNCLEHSQLVWAFQRWNLVHALFETGRADLALDTMRKWVDQESGPAILYGAPEAFMPDGRVTSLGYSWTAGRAVRAILFGLYGLRLRADGFEIQPHMPSTWTHMSLRKLEIRGTLFDIEIKRADAPRMLVDGEACSGHLVPAKWFDGGIHRVLVECPVAARGK